MKKFLFLIVVVTSCLFLFGCLNDSPTANKAKYEELINDYAHAYLSSNYQKLISLDSDLFDSLNRQGRAAPNSMQQQEFQRAMSKKINYLQALQQDKAKHMLPLFNSLNIIGGGGGAFHNALYPGVIAKIIEVRPVDNNMLTEHKNYSAMAYVKITYADINNSPPHNDRFIQDAVVKLYFQKTPDGIKIASYMPTEYELKLFEEGGSERFEKMMIYCNDYAMNRFAMNRLNESNLYFSKNMLKTQSAYEICYNLVSTYSNFYEGFGGFLDTLDDGRRTLAITYERRDNGQEGSIIVIMVNEDGQWKVDSMPIT